MNCSQLAPLPLVSVVVPTYRHERFVRDALLSVVQQPVAMEILLCDDASPDQTFAATHTVDDPRIRRWRHETNRGADATLNELILHARGRYIAILNSDDRFHPERLQRCLAPLERGEADLVGSDIRLIDQEGVPITSHWWIDAYDALKAVWQREGDWLAALWAGNLFMTSSNFVMTRSLWERLGGFRPYRYVLDYDFLLRALIAGFRLAWIDQPLLDYRLHDRNTIFEKPLAANQEAAALLRETLPLLLERFGHRVPQITHLNRQWARVEALEIAILRAEQHEALVRKDAELAHKDAELQRLRQQEQHHHAAFEALRRHATHLLAQREEELAELATPAAPPSFLARLRHTFSRLSRFGQAQWHLAGRFPGSPPQRIRGFAALRRHLRRHPEVRILSFDIFDTVVTRLIDPPERLLHRLAEFLARRLSTSAQRVWRAREQVEKALRAEAQAAGLDHECHWETLIPRWIEALTPFATPEERAPLVAAVQAEELRLERLALRSKRNALLFLRWAKRNGYHLVAISDMYLGKAQIAELLTALGFADLFDRIFVSSETRTAKYSGRLFTHVLEELNTPPSAIAHIGDNLVSDAIAPAQLGILAFFLDKPAAQRRKRTHHLAHAMAIHFRGIWPGREVAQLLAESFRSDPTTRTPEPYFQYGLTVLGPIFATFMVGLIEAVRRDQPERLYFLARDGYLFQQLFEAARPLFPDLPSTQYLYASRRTVAAAAVADGLTRDQVAFAFLNPKQQGLRTLLKTFALPEETFLPFAERYGLSPIAAPLSPDDPRLLHFLADSEVQEAVQAAGKAARALLFAYFAQHDFFTHSRVALVDIGWNATIQRYLEHSFADLLPHYPQVFGYYFALINGIHAAPLTHGTATGLFADTARGSPWERAPFDFEELFEQAARAPHATTLGYEQLTDGNVAPLLKSDEAPDRQAELRANPAIAQMQQGIHCCWRHFLTLWQLTGYRFADLKPYALALCERAVAYPTPEEVALIAELAHTEDLGHDQLLELVGPPVTWKSLLRPRRLVATLSSRTWRYAPLAAFPSPIIALVRWLHLTATTRRSR